MSDASPDTIDAYVDAAPASAREPMRALVALVRGALPGAEEAIRYRIPTWRIRGRNVVSAAAFERHCGLYPVNGAVAEAFADRIAPYLHGAATLRFTHGEPLPAELIVAIAQALAARAPTAPRQKRTRESAERIHRWPDTSSPG
jgi:uncharacterized protein YdhG (YjbR/CyaY superfamily)